MNDINPAFEALLDYLKHTREIDFTGYKRSSLMRRVNRRMQTIGIEFYSSYQDYLEGHSEEFSHLLSTLLINVTSFFRDRPAWDYIQAQVLPQILLSKAEGQTIRIWSAGCSSGEEPYSLAMLMAELLGRNSLRERVKIYATDIDEDALSQARTATYGSRAIESVPKEYLDKYFEQKDDQFVFDCDLRRSIILGRHDLVQDAPLPRIDLLVCRNTLMYFKAETQAKIILRFNTALVEAGFLFLGKAETLSKDSSLAPVDLKQRIFTKVLSANSRENAQTGNSILN